MGDNVGDVADPDAFLLLRLRGVRNGVPAEVKAVRFAQTEDEAERAAQRMNAENTDSSVEYSWTAAVAQGNGEYAFGTHTRDPAEDTVPWAPEHNQDQLCAFCEASRPLYVHRLDPTQREFRVGGDARTWPTFLATCAHCEASVLNGDDPALLRLMTWEDDDMVRTAALSAFRASDLGSEPLPEGPPDTVRL
jgi:hypothetical protein